MKNVSAYWKLTPQQRAAIPNEDLGEYYFYQMYRKKEWLDVPVEECNKITMDWLVNKATLHLAMVAKYEYQANRFEGLSKKKSIQNSGFYSFGDEEWVDFDADTPKRKK